MKKISAWNHTGDLFDVKITCMEEDMVALVSELVKQGFKEILVEDY